MTKNPTTKKALLAAFCIGVAGCGGPPADVARSDSLTPVVGGFRNAAERTPAAAAIDTSRTTQTETQTQTQSATHIALFAEQLWVEEHELRDDALDALSASEDPAAVEALSYLLSHHDARVRQDAIDALVDLGLDAVEPYLRVAAQDSHPAVREAAVDGLAELGYAVY
jgi:HEAT repeat protein